MCELGYCNIDVLNERIGFDYHVPDTIRNAMGNKEDGTGEDEEEAGNPDDDMADFLQDIDLHDVDLTNVDLNGSGVMECEFEDDDDFQPIDVFATDSPINISIYVPKVQENENTYETFCRRTQDTSWVPFAAMKDASSWTPLDKAEHKLFDEMLPSHSRNAGLETTKGYKTFAKASLGSSNRKFVQRCCLRRL